MSSSFVPEKENRRRKFCKDRKWKSVKHETVPISFFPLYKKKGRRKKEEKKIYLLDFNIKETILKLIIFFLVKRFIGT